MVVERGVLEARYEALGDRRTRFTDPQRALFESPYRSTVWWGGNGMGKSEGVAELTLRALEGALYWQKLGKAQTVMLAGNTWKQLSSTLGPLFRGMAKAWTKKGIRYEGGTIKGQRMAIYDIQIRPGVFSTLIICTFDAENIAGPRADVVITDEPLPEQVYDELWARLLGRNGRIYQTFTVTLGTAAKLEYLWQKVDDPNNTDVGEISSELTYTNTTPRGGLLERSWMKPGELEAFARSVSAVQVEMRMGRSRKPLLDTAYFSAFGPHLIREFDPPQGASVIIGIDYGTKPGTQRIVLSAHGGKGLYSHIWVMDEFQGESATDLEEDAESLLRMLQRNGLTVADVDYWYGDRQHDGGKGNIKSNDRLKAAIARSLGLDFLHRGWTAKLPVPLQRMRTPRKYNRSAYDAAEIIHRLMVGEAPRFTVHPRCVRLIENLTNWQGSLSPKDRDKHGFDALQYGVVPVVEGERY